MIWPRCFRAVLAGGMALFSGCALWSSDDPAKRWFESVRDYNHAFRWKNFEKAAQFVAAEDRAEFVSRHEAKRKDLHIESYRILKMDLSEEDAGIAVVEVEFTKLPSITLQRRRLTQHWHRVAGAWILESEESPLIEASSEDATETETGAASAG